MKLLLSLVLALSITGFSGELKSLKAGDAVPNFSLKGYDGKPYELKSVLKDAKFAVVMFISTRCPVSNAYNERMAKLNESYSKKGITFIGINSNKQEPPNEIAEHAKEKKFTFMVVKDEKNTIADAYGAEVTPEIFVVSKELKLVYHGRIDDDRKAEKVAKHDLANALDAMLAGKEVAKDQPRAFGCSIKRVEAN